MLFHLFFFHLLPCFELCLISWTICMYIEKVKMSYTAILYAASLPVLYRYTFQDMIFTFGKKFPMQGDSGSSSREAEVSTSVISSHFPCNHFRKYFYNMIQKNNWCSLCRKLNLNGNFTLTSPMTGNRREALCRAVVTPPRQLECSPSISVHWSKYGTW